MLLTERYDSFKFGVVNAIEMSEIPKEAISKAQNIYYKDNRWRKLPGLVEIHSSAVAAYPIWGLYKHHLVVPNNNFIMAYSGNDLFKYDTQTRTFSSIYSPMSLNSQVEFLEYPPNLYFGSKNDLWRRFDGGSITYSVGGNNGQASDAPRKFSKIVFNPYAGRFCGIGVIGDEDLMFYSAHIDNEGIEKWPDGNTQIIESVNGDTPKEVIVFEGTNTMFNQNSIHSGSVVGSPSNWRFQREKSQTGTIASRTVKRYGSRVFMLSPEFEVYEWPADKFITKGRVKFSINPNLASLACAEIVENRYYYLCFRSGESTPSDKYHLWVYDILGDAWYGPHKQYNLTTMFWDKDTNLLLCGGADELDGFVMEHRGKDIKNEISSVHWVNGYNFQGDNRFDKRYSQFRIKCKQEGVLDVDSQGQLEVLFNVDTRSINQQSQRLTLQDPANLNLMGTGQVRDSIIKRAFIHEQYGRGSSCQVEIKHAVQNGSLEFSEFEIDYNKRTKKENRGT